MNRKNHGSGRLAKRNYRTHSKYAGGWVDEWVIEGEFARDKPERRDFKHTFIPVNSCGIFQQSTQGGTYI